MHLLRSVTALRITGTRQNHEVTVTGSDAGRLAGYPMGNCHMSK